MLNVPATRKALALMCMATAAVMAAGCGSVPKPKRTYGNVVDYDRMTNHYDPMVSLVYSSGDHTLNEYDTLYIDSCQVEDSDLVKDYNEARQYGLWLRYTIVEAIRNREDTFRRVTADSRFRSRREDGLLVMKPKITVYDKGSGWKRYLLWSGASDLQVECKLVDAASGEVVMELVDRRRFVANTPWGPNPDTIDDNWVMELTLKETAEGLANFFKEAYDGLPGPRRASSEG